MNGNSLNYIASGCSYSRITFPDAREDEGCKQFINDCFSNLQSAGDNTKFSLLFNAWTESNFGEIFKNFKDSLSEIMADSGGLQIITQGLQVTDKIKEEVYNIQGKTADTCLSFDEIPLSFSGDRTNKNDTAGRWFDINKFDECAKQTGKNVFNQIKTFIEIDSKAKPIFIVQGNCYDTYMKWTEIALKEIPKEYHKYISGFAMAGPCLGTGMLEDIKRAFYFNQLPIETDRLHLLGIGSIKRMMPFLIFSQTGLYKNLEISYDSTTHTSGIVMGRTYMNNGIVLFSRELNETYVKIFNAFRKSAYFPKEIDIHLFFEILNINSGDFKDRYGSKVIYIKTFIGFLCFSIHNFIKHTEECFNSKEKILGLAKKTKERNIINSLYQIKNYDDFKSWERNIGRSVRSKKVSCRKIESVEIDNLF